MHRQNLEKIERADSETSSHTIGICTLKSDSSPKNPLSNVDLQTEQRSEFVLHSLKSFFLSTYFHIGSESHMPSGDHRHNKVHALWNGASVAKSGLSYSYYYCSCRQPTDNTETDVRAKQHGGGSLTSATYFQMGGRSIHNTVSVIYYSEEKRDHLR